MKLIENRISYNWRTYAKDKEYVEYKGKKYIVVEAPLPDDNLWRAIAP